MNLESISAKFSSAEVFKKNLLQPPALFPERPFPFTCLLQALFHMVRNINVTPFHLLGLSIQAPFSPKIEFAVISTDEIKHENEQDNEEAH